MYSHLNSEQRYFIQQSVQNMSCREIAKVIQVHYSTVYREIKRNSIQNSRWQVYKAKNAQGFYQRRRFKRTALIETNYAIRRRLIWLIKCYWSPEQIYNTCKLRGLEMVNLESIYQWIYTSQIAQELKLANCLRHHHRKRRKRRIDKKKRGQILNRISIEKRTEAANKRKHKGHFEIDLMKAQNGYLMVLSCRKTVFNIIKKLPDKTSHSVFEAMEKIIENYHIKSITSDNGLEFSKHFEISQIMGRKWFFADPYSPQQRGTNENQIGLIRQYINRNTDLNFISNEEILKIQDKLNSRPRKKLNYFSPKDLFL